MRITHLLLAISASLLLACCQGNPSSTGLKSGLKTEDFHGLTMDGSTDLYTMTNEKGMEVSISTFGARIVSCMVPDHNGEFRDVVLGYDNIMSYYEGQTDFGAVIGRYANRIANHGFTLDGVYYELPDNSNGNCLHGGPDGFQHRNFRIAKADGHSIELALESKDMEMGFPGDMDLRVIYTLREDNALDIQYYATTTKPTVINLTNHAYFNLSGDYTRDILDHELWIGASNFTPADERSIPTGTIESVAGTPLDFTSAKTVGKDIESDFDQIMRNRGFDSNWILDSGGDVESVSARLTCPKTGIVMEVFTTEPGIQVYTANYLGSKVILKGGIPGGKHHGICLETQHYPDSPNKPEFPSTVLRPGEAFHSQTVYRFSLK